MNTKTSYLFNQLNRWALASACALFLLLAHQASAATRLVRNLTDNGSAGSLRQVINVSGDGDVILFDVNGTIPLNSPPISIPHALTIINPCPCPLIIDAQFRGRAFNVTGGAVSMHNLTIINGYASDGGAINVGSTVSLTLSNCTIHQSYANGNSTTPGRGGAVFNRGTLTVRNSRLENNSASGAANTGSTLPTAAFGGAVFNSGICVLVGTTVSSNSASGGLDLAVGGKGAMAQGGAFFGDNGSRNKIENCTFYANQCFAGGGDSGGNAWGGAIYITTNTTSLGLINSTLNENIVWGGATRTVSTRRVRDWAGDWLAAPARNQSTPSSRGTLP